MSDHKILSVPIVLAEPFYMSDEALYEISRLGGYVNVVLSPHLGALTQEAGDRLSGAVARQAMDILEGRMPECLIW